MCCMLMCLYKICFSLVCISVVTSVYRCPFICSLFVSAFVANKREYKNIYIVQHSGWDPQTLLWNDATACTQCRSYVHQSIQWRRSVAKYVRNFPFSASVQVKPSNSFRRLECTFHFWHNSISSLMMWNLQSYPTTVLNERMWHFRGGGNILWPLLHIFHISAPCGLRGCKN